MIDTYGASEFLVDVMTLLMLGEKRLTESNIVTTVAMGKDAIFGWRYSMLGVQMIKKKIPFRSFLSTVLANTCIDSLTMDILHQI